MLERAVVPCRGCNMCCRGAHLPVQVLVEPETGDDPNQYQTVLVQDPHRVNEPGRLAHILARKPNGDCVYLGEAGCTIWNVAPYPPHMCRSFDCRDAFRMLGDRGRAAMIREGSASAELVDAFARAVEAT